jgi:hypothetical protein
MRPQSSTPQRRSDSISSITDALAEHDQPSTKLFLPANGTTDLARAAALLLGLVTALPP